MMPTSKMMPSPPKAADTPRPPDVIPKSSAAGSEVSMSESDKKRKAEEARKESAALLRRAAEAQVELAAKARAADQKEESTSC